MRHLLILFLALSGSLQAQSAGEAEVEISRGDTLQIGKAKADVFEHLDMYRKTRWAGNEPSYDTATGNGFSHSRQTRSGLAWNKTLPLPSSMREMK